ncbi:MAG: hypothetical protein P4L53_10340 [Candidatus Obscuribacterales bacterium]|nr:hypothetical protein [Candidatus Obscuribacterales bacterium]
MSAWVKSEVTRGNAQLWLRVDGEWKSAVDAGVFDNMDDRPIQGHTDWTQYSLVVDVPAESTDIVFGVMLIGSGQIWLDNVSFAAVSKDVPLTGMYSGESVKRAKANNLDFDELAQGSDEKTVVPTASPKSTAQNAIHEWYLEPKGEFEIKLDETQKHSGSRSAYIKSIVSKPTQFGQISQAFVPNKYLGTRLKLSAWAKSKLTSGTAHLWIRVDGEWNDNAYKPGCFDNMDDRPIKAETDWTQYSLVVDVPETSNHVLIGCFLDGAGEFWVDDFSLQIVGKECPLTGCYAVLKGCGKKEPANMNFEQNQDK